MQFAGWALAVVFLVALAALFVSRRAALAALVEERDRALGRAADLAGQAGRVPDLETRISQLGSDVARMRDEAVVGAAASATVAARLEAAEVARSAAESRLLQVEGDRAALQSTVNALQVDLAGAQAQLEAANTANAQLRSDLAVRDAALADQAARLQGTQGELQQAIAERSAALEQADQLRKFLETAQENMRASFRDATAGLMDERTAANKAALEESLRPFAEQLAAFQQRTEQLSGEQARDSATLVGKIGELTALNQHMADSTGALTRALKGNAKVRGDWGEMILETVLSTSGLEEGKNFRRYAHTVDEESGKSRYPDVVIDMPDGRKLVVDSKVSLVAWAAHNEADTAEQQQEALLAHATSMRGHVRDLAEKSYPKLLGSDALDITIMFVPIEGALAAALGAYPALQDEAWGKRIVFASPNTLVALLKVVERLWIRDKIQKQVDVIATEGGKLLDALIGHLEEFATIETRLAAVNKAVQDCRSRLDTSPQSVMARARRLVDAGARGKKVIPDVLAPTAGAEVLALGQDAAAILG